MDVLFAIDAPAAGPGAQAAAGQDTEAGMLSEAHNGVARLDPRALAHPGSRVTFVVCVTRLHLFDPATGQAMR